ncbi:MAG: DUF2508 family protein [Clostridia bacterium]|nr:DUF2508 family protein [Clostridia bacterium]
MKYEYVRESKDIRDKSDNEKNKELIINILKTREDLENARNNYEFAEGNLIDYFLYEIKANQAKLDYLLNKAKKGGIELNLMDSFSLRNKNII